MAVRLGWTDCHTIFSYFRGFFKIFAVPRPTALKIGCSTNLDVVMGFISLVDEIKVNAN